SECRLVLFDARGHGQSDKPYDPSSYTWDHLVGDVLAVADEVGEERINLLGYSLGGVCCCFAAKLFPERINSLIIGGASTRARSFEAFAGVTGDDPEEFLAAYEATVGEILPAESKERVLKTDIRVLSAMFNARRNEPSLAGVLASTRIPCMFFVGETDSIYENVLASAAEVPEAPVVVIPESNHRGAFINSASIAGKVLEFLNSVD
ncbi:MAG: alpha/beta fold hydrolase, partial [Burkholderiaceae bacterium]